MNYTVELTTFQKQRQQEILTLLRDQDYEYNLLLTLNFERKQQSLESMKESLRHWTHKASKSVWGHNWQKNNSGIRYVATAESIDNLPHFHLITGVPKEKLEYAPELLCQKWKQLKAVDLRNNGTHWVPIYDLEGIAGYIVKKLVDHKSGNSDYWTESMILRPTDSVVEREMVEPVDLKMERYLKTIGVKQ